MDFDSKVERALLDRARMHRPAAARRAIRFRKHGFNGVRPAHQGVERGNREFRRAGETQP
jgi:hypothetical protein